MHSPTRRALESVAAEWLARRDAGWTAAEQAEHEAWLAADPRHAEAWEELEASWIAFDRARRSGVAREMMVALAVRQRRRRWRVYAGTTAGLAAAACVAVLLVIAPAPEMSFSPSPTEVILARPERRSLSDGSMVELNAGAEVAVNFSSARREVQLTRGEAHFTVAKDAARPFVVAVGAVKIRAVGTAFAIKIAPLAVDVLVTEGRVAVDSSNAMDAVLPAAEEMHSASVIVEAGGRLSVPATGFTGKTLRAESVTQAEIEQSLAWRGPRFELSGTPLTEVVAVLNRENALRIIVRDPALREMRLSGVFRADNPEVLLRLLESHYGVTIERRGLNQVILRQAR